MKSINKRTGFGRLRTNTPLLVSGFVAAFGLAAGSLTLATNSLADAFGGHTLYVRAGASAADTGKGCGHAKYGHVQDAVNAAGNGDTVYLCGPQFAEQVFVRKSITLTGDMGSGLTAVGATFSANAADYPAQFAADGLFVPQALLVTTGDKVQVNGLKISGPFPGNGGCASDQYGVLTLDGAISLKNDVVANVADTNPALYGCQYGVGVQVGRTYWPKADFATRPAEHFSATATIDGVTVSGYQKNGITVDGTGSSATISDSVVAGGGYGAPFGSIIAQNGIQISRGARGSVQDSTISDNAYSGAGYATSAGVLVYGGYGDPLVKNVTVKNNKLINNDVAVDFVNYTDDGSGPATTVTKNVATGNWIYSSNVTNKSGLCDGSAACGGGVIGYQAGVQDVGNKDSACSNTIFGPGYTEQGDYDYSVTPPVFTQTGVNAAVVRAIDAGDTFPTTDFDSCDHGPSHGHGHYNKSFFPFYHHKFGYWFYH